MTRIRFVPAFLFLFLAIFAGPKARAASVVICSATEDPLEVRAEGITERVGDFVLNCSGGSPGQQVLANITVYLSVPITNRISGNNVTDVVFTADSGLWRQAVNAPGVLRGNALTSD